MFFLVRDVAASVDERYGAQLGGVALVAGVRTYEAHKRAVVHEIFPVKHTSKVSNLCKYYSYEFPHYIYTNK